MKRYFVLFLIISLFVTTSCDNSVEESSCVTSYDDIPIITEPNTLNTLKVGYTEFTGNFNPFYAIYSNDKDVVNVTSVSLLTFDNDGDVIYNAIDGITEYIDGKEFILKGIADVDIREGTEGKDIVSITLDENIRFSDGHLLNIDDVIFTMYVLADPSYDGPSLFNSLPLEGLEEYMSSDLKYISGIEKTSDFSLDLYLNDTENDVFQKLSIIVAPLHYYGSEYLYNYDESNFGFEKGSLGFLQEKSSCPLGAGPYTFVSYNDEKVSFKRNESYFNGTPDTEFLEFVVVSVDDKIDKLNSGEIHIVRAKNACDTLKKINEMNGGSDYTRINVIDINKNGYTYIGISAENISVDYDVDSEQSKNLRKAFATLFSVYKYECVNDYFVKDYTIEYPISRDSWAYPSNGTLAYSVNADGEHIYSENLTAGQRYELALIAAKEFLVSAGYLFDENIDLFTKAPSGAKLEYDIAILDDGTHSHPAYKILSDVRYSLSTLGITLNIIEYDKTSDFWDDVYGSDCSMWVAGFEYPTQEPILMQNYYGGGNKFGICDVKLDSIIEEYSSISNIEIKKAKIHESFLIIRDWAVEIPLYESSEAVFFNSEYINTKSISAYMFNRNFTDYMHLIELK